METGPGIEALLAYDTPERDKTSFPSKISCLISYTCFLNLLDHDICIKLRIVRPKSLRIFSLTADFVT
jgi:hypothetical protein